VRSCEKIGNTRDDRSLTVTAPKELVAKRLITMKLRKVHFRPDIGPKRDQFFPSLTGPQAQLVARNGHAAAIATYRAVTVRERSWSDFFTRSEEVVIFARCICNTV
jgi:hypothetical protein